MVLDNLTKLGKVGVLLFIIGTVFFLVGFAVPYWMVWDHVDANSGLWQYCAGGSCGDILDIKTDSWHKADWFRGTQALACLALIALIIDFVLLILFLFCSKPKKFLLIAVIFNIIAAVLAFLAAVVYGSELDNTITISLSWGFAFDIIGGIFLSGGAICLFIEYIRR